jgi:hypothetical protein
MDPVRFTLDITTISTGSPAKETLKVTMPNNIDSIVITNREITFRIYNKGEPVDIVVISKVNLTGSISNTRGIKYISIESKGDHVEISDS